MIAQLESQLWPAMTVLWRASWQAAVIALLVLGVQWVLGRRLPASWRHNLWFLVLLRLILPVTPSSHLSLFNYAPKITQASSEVLPEWKLTATSPRVVIESVHRHSHWKMVLSATWAVGVIMLLTRMLIASVRLSRAVRAMQPVNDREVLDLLDRCARQVGVRRLPIVLHSKDFPAPALMGFVRPRLLLPTRVLTDFAPQELRLIALHELAHLKRRDVAINWLLAVLATLHWFNPMLWLAFARLRTDRELAADEMVLSLTAGPDRSAYGDTIVKLLQTLTSTRSALPGTIGILERAHPLRRRITMIAQFKSLAPRWTVLAATCMLALAALALTDAVRGDDASVASATPASHEVLPSTKPSASTKGTLTLGRGTSASEAAIATQFQRKLPEVRFDAVPFPDVVDFIRDVTGANINVSWRALESAGVDRNTPISIRVRDVSFEHVLRQLCREAGGGQAALGFTVDGGVIVISTLEDLSHDVRARAYDVSDLMERKHATTQPAGAQLIDLITENVAPDSWRDKGGTMGSIKEYDGRLVITTIDMYHLEITRLLNDLRSAEQ